VWGGIRGVEDGYSNRAIYHGGDAIFRFGAGEKMGVLLDFPSSSELQRIPQDGEQKA